MLFAATEFSNSGDPAIWLLTLSWLFAFGSCIGSFLNVVVYRVPLGKNLSAQGSSCPKCGHAIRWYHNVPVFGWLWLRGKCRDCRAPISIRYPLVELLVGLIFVGLGWFELCLGGANLPQPVVARLFAAVGNSAYTHLAVTLALHAWAACLLVAATLMLRDGASIPARFWIIGLSVALVMSLLPWVVKPVPIATRLESFSWLVGPLGALAGGLLSAIISPLITKSSPREASTTWVSGALCGAVLGWQGVVLLLPVVASLWLLDGLFNRALRIARPMPYLAYLTAGLLLYLLLWRWIALYVPLG